MSKLADDLERLCCAETEGKFFDLVTDSITEILAALRKVGAEPNTRKVSESTPRAGFADLTALAEQFQELNMSNYNEAQVEELNSWGIEIVNAVLALAVPAQPETGVREALKPLAMLGGPMDGHAAAFHDLPADTVVFENSGQCITAGDVRNARRVYRYLSTDEAGGVQGSIADGRQSNEHQPRALSQALPPLHFAAPVGGTFDEMRENVWKTGLADIGDTILVWVNEGDFWMHQPTIHKMKYVSDNPRSKSGGVK